MEQLTNSELNWLTTRGGRTPGDVEVDEIGKYVIMHNSDGLEVKVYIPSNFKLEIHSAYAIHNRRKGWKPKKYAKRKKKKLVQPIKK